LQDILASPGFENSAQLRNFLSFIVKKTLDDKTHEIKGYTIGVDALGRPDDFDPQTDPSVRVMAGRLRQTLENYNRDTGGFIQEDENVRIELIKGNYVPKISFAKVKENPGRNFQDKLAALEETNIDIGLDTIKPKSIESAKKRSFSLTTLASIIILTLIFASLSGYHYYSQHLKIEPTILPQKQTIAIEDATLPSLTLFISAKQEFLPNWITREKIESSAVVAFTGFNEYRVFDYRGEEDLLFLDQITSDYYLSIFFSKASDSEALEVFLTLTRPPESEVVWSHKAILLPPVDGEKEKNLQKIKTITSEIMSPYGIIHGDITSNINPPPRLDCIRAVYSYFAKEDLQAYANGLDCARRAISRDNASSSMYAMLTFLYVEAFRKQIVEVSKKPLSDAESYAKKAITLDPGNARAFQALFAVEKTSGNKKAAIKAATKALSLNPNDREIIGDYAAYLVSINEQEKAKPILEEAIRLTPVLPAWLAFYTYLNADVTGDFKTADILAKKFQAEESPLLAAAIILSTERSGDEARALAASNILNIIEPGFAKNPRAALLRRGLDKSFANEIATRLEKAGLNKQLTQNKN